MLGKTFYVLLTGRNPLYLMNDNIQPALFHVLSRCCNPSKNARFQSLADLRQTLVSAYDVLLNRAGGVLQEAFAAIRDRLAISGQYSADEVRKFIDQLALADRGDQRQYIQDFPESLFSVVAQPPVADKLMDFLNIYEAFIDSRDYSFSYAETVANRMSLILQEQHLPAETRAYALDLAIRAAHYMNRFAAMDTCRALIRAIQDGELAFHVAPVILKPEAWFLGTIDPSSCNNETIRNAIRTIKNAQAG